MTSRQFHGPSNFADALRTYMSAHNDTCHTLSSKLSSDGVQLGHYTIKSWTTGRFFPRAAASLLAIRKVEEIYNLKKESLFKLLPSQSCGARRRSTFQDNLREARKASWHIPDDFKVRPLQERIEIIKWIQDNVLSGTTEYRRYSRAASRSVYSLKPPPINSLLQEYQFLSNCNAPDKYEAKLVPDRLRAELADLVSFKTDKFTRPGFVRTSAWSHRSATIFVRRLCMMLGAFTTRRNEDIQDEESLVDQLSVGLILFPNFLRWYLDWQESRRGFITRWEVDLLSFCASLTREKSGWLYQSSWISQNLREVRGLVAGSDIKKVQDDWIGACEKANRYCISLVADLKRIKHKHRDPFEAISPVLETKSPLTTYKRIPDAIVSLMPDARYHLNEAAFAVRALLVVRLALHLGVRQRNLRELLICHSGCKPRNEDALARLGCGEIYHDNANASWVVFFPRQAFKNADSSFFNGQSIKIVLPDTHGLYHYIRLYAKRDRRVLLGNNADPGTFFIKAGFRNSSNARFDQQSFYRLWVDIIRRYGIWNPYTGKGAIKGLLPHGPHAVRDILATHIIKQTGSYLLASYAIQDTPSTVAKYYARFIPKDKAYLAAEILDLAWQS